MAFATAWPLSIGPSAGEPLWWMQVLSLAAMVSLLNRSTQLKEALFVGLAFATTWLCATFWWLHISMHVFGGLNSLIAAMAILALALALGVYYALACGVYWLLRRHGALRAAALFAALWTMAEMARGTWLTGFGWGAVGYAHATGPLAAYIPWLGVYGVGALAAGMSAAIAATLLNTQRNLALAAVIGVAAIGALLRFDAHVWTQSTGHLSVALLQGNIPQDEKFQPSTGVPFALRWYAEELERNQSDLVVGPETAIPLLPRDLPENYWETLTARFSNREQAALLGIPLGDMVTGYTNSVVALAPVQPAGWQYDKHHLVPFGEFIPPLFKWFTKMMNIPLGDFNRGAIGQASFPWKGQRLAPNICYEDLFGEELAARFKDADSAPTIFVNLSNIGWFGNSIAIDQHLQISRMRALEFERPMIRATNTGATVIIDHKGQITDALPRHTRGVLTGEVDGRTGTTPFAWWAARFGLWPIWLAAIAIVLLAARAGRIRTN